MALIKYSLHMRRWPFHSLEATVMRDVYKKMLLYVRKNTFKIPVNTYNFTVKKIHFHAFLTILFRV